MLVQKLPSRFIGLVYRPGRSGIAGCWQLVTYHHSLPSLNITCCEDKALRLSIPFICEH